MTAVDDHLANCAPDDRAALVHLRALVHELVPDVVEVLSYRLPAFALAEGSSKMIFGGFSAGTRFLSWYPFSGKTITTLADELAGFETTKGSIHFTPARTLSADLVRLLVHTRIDEIDV